VALIFPAHRFNPSTVKVSLVGNVVTSPATISGAVQVLRTDGGGLMRVDMSGIVIRTPEQIRKWRAWIGELGGGTTVVRVPVVDIRRAPMAMAGQRLNKPVVVRNTDVDPWFSEASPYGPNRAIVATISASALRARQATITIAKGSPVHGGEYFGILYADGTSRVHMIKRVLSRSGFAAVVTFEPPLRAAVSDNTPVDFEWPCFSGRLVPDGDYAPEISLNHGSTSISFIEAF
jgi:hypothetical protein